MRIMTTAFLALITLSGTLGAQPYEPGPGMDSNDAGGLPPAERWMERMRRHHPEEYQRMEHIRRENPAAFRGMLREKVDTKRVDAVMREYPPLNNAYQSLPPDKRAGFIKKLYDRPRGPRGDDDPGRTRGRRPPADDEKPSSEIQQLDAEIMELGELYRDETNPAVKKEIKERLEAKLHAMADTLDRHRTEKIAQMEKTLEELKQSLTERQKNREEMIARHLVNLTGED